MQLQAWLQTLTAQGTSIGLHILGAIALWVIGRSIARWIVRAFTRTLTGRGFDVTLISYIRSSLTATLNVILVVLILGFFGVETTTFAALFAAVGVAIGMAWSGLLANFAAGIFLVLLRPFKVGDFITAAGVTGTVKEIGLFVTVVDTMDNVVTILGNNKVFAETIQNYSVNAYRRVDLVAQLNHSVDHRLAIPMLRERLARIPNVMKDPAPVIEILNFEAAGPVLAVRPFTHNDNYWQVYFDTNRAIREAFGEAAFPPPEPHYAVRGSLTGSAAGAANAGA
jgi:small conductance mechanosensitive channel